jgi:hypothetical protein
MPVSNSGPGNDDPVPDDTTGPDENTLTDDNALGTDTAPLGDNPLGNGEGGPGVDDAAGAGTGAGAVGDEPGMGMGMGGIGSAAEDGLAPSDSVMLREVNSDLAPDSAAGNAVIGDESGADAEDGFLPMEGARSGQRDDRERRRKAWLNDDRDIWGNPISSTPSVLDDGS